MPFSTAWSGRLALLVGAVLVLLIAWQGVRLAWMVVEGPQVTPHDIPEVPRVSPAGSGRNGEFRWELFGTSDRPPVIHQPVPASQTSLRLRGVVASGSGGYAIISGADSDKEVYRVGDELPDGARIDAIEPRRVLLVRNGRSEALEMERNGGTGAPRSSSTARRSGSPTPHQTTLPGIRPGSLGEGASIASMRDLASGAGVDVASLAGAISVQPVAGGGFRVRPGRDATLFSRLGLQVNDVVVAVNGQPLDSEESARSLFAEVMQRGEISITVNRQGREITLRPDLENIAEGL